MDVVPKLLVVVIQFAALFGGGFYAYYHYVTYGPFLGLPDEMSLERVMAPITPERFYSAMRVMVCLGFFSLITLLRVLGTILTKNNILLDDLAFYLLQKRSAELRRERNPEHNFSQPPPLPPIPDAENSPVRNQEDGEPAN